MTAFVPIPLVADADRWDEAIRSANAWRGQALQSFAQAEAAVSETLLVLAEAPCRGAKVKLRRLVGHRFQDLADALAEGGPFAAEGIAASAALADFRRHEALRATLCHGVAKITLDRKGEWLILLKLLAFQARKAERSSIAMEQRAAQATLDDIKDSSQRLATALGNVRKSVGG